MFNSHYIIPETVKQNIYNVHTWRRHSFLAKPNYAQIKGGVILGPSLRRNVVKQIRIPFYSGFNFVDFVLSLLLFWNRIYQN